MKLKPADYFIIIIVIFFIFYSYKIKERYPLKYVKIVTPYKTLIYPLKKDNIVTVKGKIGFLKVEIKHKKVRVISSNCPNKICIKTGWISSSNEYIACVPNGVLITLTGINKVKEYDYITQ